MSRNRKPLSEQRGHLTVLAQNRKEREEALARGGFQHVVNPPRGVLTDKEARKKWKYIVDVKMADKSLSDADFDNMVVYCNAWSSYLRSAKLQTKADEVGTSAEEIADLMNIAVRLEKQSVDILYKYGARLGLDLNSRLKTASVKVEKEQKQVENRFGVI